MKDADFKGLALFGTTIAVELIATLARKGVLSREETRETIDRCLYSFETRVGDASPEAIDAIQLARQICEVTLAQIDARMKTPRRNSEDSKRDG